MKYCTDKALFSVSIEEPIGVSAETMGVVWIYIKDTKEECY